MMGMVSSLGISHGTWSPYANLFAMGANKMLSSTLLRQFSEVSLVLRHGLLPERKAKSEVED